MVMDRAASNVLVITDSEETGDRLAHWIAATGENPVLLTGNAGLLIERGDDETVDLVVTDLDTDDPTALQTMVRLLNGELLDGIPQIHILRDFGFRKKIKQRNTEMAAIAMPSPVEASEFQVRVRLAAELGRLRREVSRISIRDQLTGLYNRRYLLYRLEDEIYRARRYRTHLSLVMFDIDRLRLINNRYGESVGDRVIREVSAVLKRLRRRPDLIGATGEESFGLVLPATRYRGAATLANKVRNEIESMSLFAGDELVEVRISGGVAAYPDNPAATGPEDLLGFAERALVEAKKRGGNRVYIDEGTIQGDRHLAVIVDRDQALLDQAEDLLVLDNYDVVRADSPGKALETLRFRRPDLLIIDLQMLSQPDDTPLIVEVLNIHSEASFPIIGLSTETDLDPDDLKRLGVDRFITKPFSISLLRNMARELVESGAGEI